MTITVRRATLNDLEAIARFLPAAYPGRWQYKYPERWHWAYVDNPFLEDDRPPVWIAVTEEGEVVGQTGALIEPLKLGEEEFRVGWSVDTFLLPEFRGQGIGYRLQEANDQANPIFMSLSMSDSNRRIKKALGSRPVDPVTGFIKTLRHEPDRAREAFLEMLFREEGAARRGARRLFRSLRLDRALANLLNAGRARRDKRLAFMAAAGVEIEPVDRFGEEVDRLWETVAPHHDALVRRDHVFLNWKFVEQPHAHHVRFLARRKGEVSGYVIVRRARPPEPDIGLLVDLLASPNDRDTLFALVSHAIEYLDEAQVESIHAASSSPLYHSLFETFGFRQALEVIPMMHCRVTATACARAAEPGAWFLGRGDHDWDQYPNA